ncbi:synaptic vesicle membrane protein VAT-1 homolog-like [Haliotis rufescens]|uniref:synaptic vesicle membrane protein VAT-1 homolog-like n=1 Tax=Haliotis rufescens TaxID=6454 RepID=UPI001EAFAB23|nr:synaptic vesicle membrane protein VAT-1 homolog-like [Haliotis rufescens]
MAETQAPTVEPAAEAKPDVEAPAAPTKVMKSVVLTGFGGLKMLKVQQKPEVTAAGGELLVRVRACGMNFPDLMVRQGVIDTPPKTPVIMGFECSGIVEAVGENTTGFKVGDRVIGFTNYNAWAELVNINANHVFKMPDNMSFQDGAALPMNYVTAYILLFDMANLRKGQSLLVHSVGGGVGNAITQLCKTVEDVTVFGTASSNKHEAIKANVSHIFDHNVDYAQEVRKVAAEGVDIVLDCMCGDDTNKGIMLLKPMGKYLLYGSSNIVTGETKSFFSFAKSWWQVDKVNPIKLFDENKVIGGFQLRRLLFNQGQHGYVREVIEKLFKMYSAGKINPTIDSVWAFEDVSDAMQKMQDRKNVGKVLLDPTAEPKPKDVEAEKAAVSTDAESGDKQEKKEEKPVQDGK